MNILSIFPERLRDLMFFHDDIKSDSLGKAVGISGTCIRSFLRGETIPSLKNAVAIADFFHCSLNYLAGMSDHYQEVLPRPLPPFYENLRNVMDHLGVSRYNVAHHSKIQDSNFTNWAKGKQPKFETVCTLAEYLNVSLDYLVGRTDY